MKHFCINNDETDILTWSMEDFGESTDSVSKQELGMMAIEPIYYSVVHIIYNRYRRPIVKIGRIYLANGPEEAIRKYMRSYPPHHSGTNETWVAVEVCCAITEGYQEFESFEMPDGIYSLSSL